MPSAVETSDMDGGRLRCRYGKRRLRFRLRQPRSPDANTLFGNDVIVAMATTRQQRRESQGGISERAHSRAYVLSDLMTIVMNLNTTKP